ncbi:MAG: hypothetical protein ACI4T5_09660 [Prevotella sp.]
MIYAIINRKMAIEAGFKEISHVAIDNFMVVNENELRLLGDDIDETAKRLEGYLMTNSEVKEWIRTKNSMKYD